MPSPVAEFGDRFALNESLSLALQFSSFRNERQQKAIRRVHQALAKDILSYVDAFRSSLSTEQFQDMQFSYKVFLFPKPANRERGADLAVEFIKYDPNNLDEMARISRAVALIKPAAGTVAQVDGRLITEPGGLPVRVVTELNAPAVRAINYDETHPYRQLELLRRIKELLPEGVFVTTYDLAAVRHSFDIMEKRDYYYKSRFGSVQYSEAYAQWIALSYTNDPEFFRKAREKYYDDRH